eukprot:5384000-Pleurochrysis_carterae.AAC.10
MRAGVGLELLGARGPCLPFLLQDCRAVHALFDLLDECGHDRAGEASAKIAPLPCWFSVSGLCGHTLETRRVVSASHIPMYACRADSCRRCHQKNVSASLRCR